LALLPTSTARFASPGIAPNAPTAVTENCDPGTVAINAPQRGIGRSDEDRRVYRSFASNFTHIRDAFHTLRRNRRPLQSWLKKP
jgi:hypothetical protein